MSFILPAIETALALGQSLPKIFGGNKELEEANRLGKIRQPKFRDITPEQTALNLARLRALSTRLPGQSLIEQKIGQATATGQRYASETAASPVDALFTANAMTANQQNALGDLSVQAANMFDKNQDILRQENKDFGGILTQKWDWEQRQPYIWAKQKEAMLRKAGAENVQHGWEGALGAISGGLLLADNKGLFDSNGSGKSLPMSSTVGSNTSNIFNPASTTAPENYPFENAFPTSIPSSTNNMGGDNMREVVIQRFNQRYGRMPTAQELMQLGY